MVRQSVKAGQLGIDFGTSNSAIAWADASGKVTLIPIEADAVSMPTALFFNAEESRTQFGRDAVDTYLSGAEGRLMRSLKSLLGSELMKESTEVFGRAVRFVDIIGFYMGELKRRAEAYVGHPIDSCVVGRPVHFVDDDPQSDQLAQDTLKEAAQSVGFKHIRFQFEPIAAALDFEASMREPALVLVADIGGGTSDFSLTKLGSHPAPSKKQSKADRSSDVLATTGVHLAGTDFDQMISLQKVMPLFGYGHVGKRNREVPRSIFFDLATWHRIHFAQSDKSIRQAKELDDTYSDLVMHKRLLRLIEYRLGHHLANDVEQTKIANSIAQNSQSLKLDYIEPGLAQTISEADVQAVLDATMKKIMDSALQCVAQGAMKPSDIQLVYLTGGSSALASFQRAMQQTFPQARLVSGDLFGSVAAGLARS